MVFLSRNEFARRELKGGITRRAGGGGGGGGLAAKTLFSLFLCKSDQDFVPTEVQASFKDGPYFQKTPSPPWRKFYLG